MTYEYSCKRCALTFAASDKKLSDREAPCPSCNSMAPRIISRGSFQLKGDGWAKDGYS